LNAFVCADHLLLAAAMNSLQQIVRLRDDPMAMQEWLGKHPLYDLKERVCTRSTVDDFDKREDWVDERLLLGRYLYSIAKLYHQAQPPHSASNSGLHSGVDHTMRCSNRFCSEAIGVWNDACKLYYEHVLPRKKGSEDLQEQTEQSREAHFLSTHEFEEYFSEYRDAIKIVQEYQQHQREQVRQSRPAQHDKQPSHQQSPSQSPQQQPHAHTVPKLDNKSASPRGGDKAASSSGWGKVFGFAAFSTKSK
jgi:hypothetical protein